jgi:hypothetical protein
LICQRRCPNVHNITCLPRFAPIRAIGLFHGAGIGAGGLELMGIPFCAAIDGDYQACVDVAETDAMRMSISEHKQVFLLSVKSTVALNDVLSFIDSVPCHRKVVLHARIGGPLPESMLAKKKQKNIRNRQLRAVHDSEWKIILKYLSDRETKRNPSVKLILMLSPSCKVFSTAGHFNIHKKQQSRTTIIKKESSNFRRIMNIAMEWYVGNKNSNHGLVLEEVYTVPILNILKEIASTYKTTLHYKKVEEKNYKISACNRKRLICASERIPLELFDEVPLTQHPITVQEALYLPRDGPFQYIAQQSHFMSRKKAKQLQARGVPCMPTSGKSINNAEGPTVVASSALKLQRKQYDSDRGTRATTRHVTASESIQLMGWPCKLWNIYFPWLASTTRSSSSSSWQYYHQCHVGNGIALGTSITLAGCIWKSLNYRTHRDRVLNDIQEMFRTKE